MLTATATILRYERGELVGAVRARETGGPLRLNVGIADAMSEFVTYRLLAPARPLASPIHRLWREYRVERLLAALYVHTCGSGSHR